MKTFLFLVLSLLFFTSCKEKCKSHFKYSKTTIDLTGLNVSAKKAGVEIANVGVGELNIDGSYIEANERLQILDLVQKGLCGQIRGVDKDSPLYIELKREYANAMQEMVNIAKNPEAYNPKP